MLRPNKPVVMIVKYHDERKTSGNQQKLKELLKFHFRRRWMLAMGLQEQGVKQEKFKTQQLMPV